MSFDLPLVRGHVDPAVTMRESVSPAALVRSGEADIILVDPSGYVLIDEAGAGSDAARLRRVDDSRGQILAQGTTASFIGVIDSRPVVAIETTRESFPGRWEHLRTVGWHLAGDDAAAALSALALAAWHRDYRYCSRCGTPVHIESGGWVARCRPCERLEYPRQDPAVIVLVRNHADSVLLAHNVAWKPTAVSLIAGYVEAGESPDVAVRREVDEEAGITIEDPVYVATQPWPFGRSQMMGYLARTLEADPTPRADGVEIEWARFYSRDELTRALADGRVTAPGRSSIAYALLAHWYGSDLPGVGADTGRNVKRAMGQ